jgi:phage FluMu protein Com
MKLQDSEFENIISCINCGQVLFSCDFIGKEKIKCPKCQQWQTIEFDEKKTLKQAREPPKLQVINE